MSIFQRIPALRWIAPAAAVAVIVGGGALLDGVTADAATNLPARSAAQLLVDVQQASLAGLSGTVVQTSDLGLPDLPGIGASLPGAGGGSSDLTALVAGTHTLRLWYAGPQQVRVALLGSLGESDVIRNGRDLWIWSSQSNTATHRTLAATETGNGDGATPGQLSMTPQQAAAAALAAIGPSTSVGTDSTADVAGRPAYELVLQPRDAASLVGQVRIAVDATEHVPLRVQVYPAGQPDPAFQVAFSSVDFSRPDPAEFAFNPPPGATVNQGGDQGGPTAKPPAAAKEGSAAIHPKVVGSGWTSVLVTGAPSASGSRSLTRILGALPTVSGSWGSGHLLTTRLLSVLITDKGVMAIGAVAPERLYAAVSAG